MCMPYFNFTCSEGVVMRRRWQEDYKKRDHEDHHRHQHHEMNEEKKREKKKIKFTAHAKPFKRHMVSCDPSLVFCS